MEIEKISSKVGIAFMRVIKERNMYEKFVKTFKNQLNKMGMLNNNREVSFDDVMRRVVSQAQKNVEEIKRRVNGDMMFMPTERKDAYDLSIAIINELIHMFLEPITKDKRLLGVYGQDMFDLTCSSLFGNEYSEDMTNMEKLKGKENDNEMQEINMFDDDDEVEIDFVDDDVEYDDDCGSYCGSDFYLFD